MDKDKVIRDLIKKVDGLTLHVQKFDDENRILHQKHNELKSGYDELREEHRELESKYIELNTAHAGVMAENVDLKARRPERSQRADPTTG